MTDDLLFNDALWDIVGTVAVGAVILFCVMFLVLIVGAAICEAMDDRS